MAVERIRQVEDVLEQVTLIEGLLIDPLALADRRACETLLTEARALLADVQQLAAKTQHLRADLLADLNAVAPD